MSTTTGQMTTTDRYEHPVVFKYVLPEDGPGLFGISMPKASQLLTVQMQPLAAGFIERPMPMLWAAVFRNLPMVSRRILCVGTGQPVTDLGRYIATIQIDGFVWHYFDNGEVTP